MRHGLKSILFAIFVAGFFPLMALSREDTKSIASHFSYNFSMGAGALSDFTKEYVYYEDGDVMSRLDWDSPFSPCISLSGEASFFHAVLGADFLIAVPIKCGSMEDWDYLKYDHTRATNYSKSELIMNKHYEFEVKGGYEFVFKGFRVLPQAGFHYRNQKMEASGGYLQYGSLDAKNGGYWSEDLEKYELVGTVITYEQQFFMPFASLDAEYTFLRNWRAKIFGRWYPSIKCDAIDMHNERMTQFNDFMTGGSGFSVGAGIQYKSFGLSVSYEHLSCADGYTTQRNFGHTTYVSESDTLPGCESNAVTVRLTYHIQQQ